MENETIVELIMGNGIYFVVVNRWSEYEGNERAHDCDCECLFSLSVYGP